jgi:hypothetical protein
MRLIQAPLLAGILVLATASAPAQDTRSGVQGVLRSDGTFRPFVLRAITGGGTGTENIGEFVATISIKFVTKPISGTLVECTLTATAEGENSSGLIDDFVETASAWVEPPSAANGTATCSLKLPYRWKLNGTNDRVAISYSIAAPASAGFTPAASDNARTSQGSLATIAMPADDSVTVYKVETRI